MSKLLSGMALYWFRSSAPSGRSRAPNALGHYSSDGKIA